ncbi:MAG: tetratricopeptide repeat protein [Armatimonadota bacterium]|nr:tetratricopeptide repeat protein [Armatimonadota bacterium]
MHRSIASDAGVTHRRLAVVATAALLAAAVATPARAQGSAAEWADLITRYEAQVARAPGDATARYTLAMLYARNGRLLDGYRQLQEADQAVGHARRLEVVRQIVLDAEASIRQNPRDLLARYRLAFARYFLNQPQAAAAEFERVVAMEPRNDWGFGYLGQAYAAAGQDDRAVAAWQRGLQVNPGNSVLHYVLGLMYTKRNDRRRAATHFAAAYRDRTLYDYVTGNRR